MNWTFNLSFELEGADEAKCDACLARLMEQLENLGYTNVGGGFAPKEVADGQEVAGSVQDRA